MNYYCFDKKEILQKAKEKYGNCAGKEKAAEYYKTNKVVLNEKVKNWYSRRRKRGKKRVQQR